MRWMRFSALFLSLIALSLAPAGCALEAEDAATRSDELAGCESDLGLAIVDVAKRGRNTFSGSPTTTRNRVEAGPFLGGVAIAEASANLIRSAKREVIIELFDIEDDTWMAKQLGEAVRSLPDSVDVHVLVNPATGSRFFVLEESRDDTRSRLKKLLGDRKNIHVAAWDTKGFLGVMHSKQIVVDGRHALMTDTNFQHNGDPASEGGKEWFQLATQVEGDVGMILRRDAVDALREAGDSTAISESALPVQAPLATCLPMSVYGREANAGEDASANLGYVGLFTKAQHTVNVLSPNLNDDHALDALAAATEHAQVRILLSKGFNDSNENLWTQGGTNEDNVGRMKDRAKNPCNLEMRWYAAKGKAIDGNLTYANHAKWASADGIAMILGSQNLDTQSWKKSRELNLLLDDRAATASFDAIFEDKWGQAGLAYACKR